MSSATSCESPARAIRPLEVHSPNASNIEQHDDSAMDVAMKSPAPVKGTPSSSSAPRMPALFGEDDDGENRTGRGRGGGEASFRLSPIGRVNFDTPGNNDVDGMDVSETPMRNDATFTEGATDQQLDASFPDETIEIRSPGADADEDDEEEEDGEEREETEEERMQREIEESEALARQLMAEEAMASYAMSTNYLNDNADQFSEEDLAALRAAMAEEDPEADANAEEGDIDGGEGDEEGEMSYDALLRLGERIGDVKEERWALVARQRIDELPTLAWEPGMAEGREENHTEVKCQVCQFKYEGGDVLRRLPCGHCFHRDCVDGWLGTKDTCALCRKSILVDK